MILQDFVRPNSRTKEDITSKEVIATFALSAEGKSAKEIGEIIGRSPHMVAYIRTQKFKSAEKLVAFTGCNNLQEMIEAYNSDKVEDESE